MQMLTKIPIASCPISIRNIIHENPSNLRSYLATVLKMPYFYFFDSGTSALLVALRALTELSQRNEVIIPAYTSHNIVVAIEQAGLVAILCDINMHDFNIDMEKVASVITDRTLAVIVVHSFGIPVRGLDIFKKRYSHIFLIEDCAQSFGSSQDGKPLGSFGDISILSFNRGKNITSYSGGAIVTGNIALSNILQNKLKEIPCQTAKDKILNVAKIFVLKVALIPFFYKVFDAVLKNFKETGRASHINPKRYTRFQGRVICSLIKIEDSLTRARYNNGMQMINSLSDDNGLALPMLDNGAVVAFNRLPIFVKDLTRLVNIRKKLEEAGIESSPMYKVPMHHLFSLGYSKDEFPNSVELARHLITVPTHPGLNEMHVKTIVNVIRSN